jgi:hypothetical protein
MATALPRKQAPAAHIAGDVLVLADFKETDQEVVRVVGEAEDAEVAVHRCLQVGARALHLAEVSTDSGVVEKAFDEMKSAFKLEVSEAVERIRGTTDALINEEDGELRKALDQWLTEVSGALDTTFDENDKRSAVSKLESILEKAAERSEESLRRALNPENEESPLGQLAKSVSKQLGTTAESIRDLSERIAIRKAEAEIFGKTSKKGFTYEEVLHEAVAPIAAVHGDVAEQVGKTCGVAGTQAGDELVTLAAEDIRGLAARYVLEAKDRKLPLRAILDELAAALEKRGALAAIAVFSRDEHAPIPASFQQFDNRAIVVLDKDDLDDRALRLACCWVRPQLANSDEAVVDLERSQALIDDARRALGKVTGIRRAHSVARKNIDQASDHVDELIADLETVLDTLTASSEVANESQDDGRLVTHCDGCGREIADRPFVGAPALTEMFGLASAEGAGLTSLRRCCLLLSSHRWAGELFRTGSISRRRRKSGILSACRRDPEAFHRTLEGREN